MYNFRDEDEIKRDMLKNIKNTVDRSENSIIHDALGPTAIELQNVNVELDYVADKIDPENLEALELERYTKQNSNTTRKLATNSADTVKIAGSEGSIVRQGELVSTGNVSFIIQETKQIDETGIVEVLVECEEKGSVGNVPAHTIVKFPTSISGLNSVTNPMEFTNGYDDENDRELLDRHYEKIRKPITSANIYHYLQWAKEVEGVGNARIIPQWRDKETISTIKSLLDNILLDGKYSSEDIDNIIEISMQHALSVKAILIDSNKQNASRELIEEVQEHIDPGRRGLGEGKAPIGAFCTVVSADERAINISVNITRNSDFSLEQIKGSIEEEVTEYLKTIAFNKSLISYAQIGALILDVAGVEDYTELKVNEGIENIRVGNEEVAVLGEVIANEQAP